MNVEEYLQDLADKRRALRKELSKESDRGCALYAVSYIESALSDLLYCALASDKKIEKDLFEGTAPLSTFSAKINMAYYLGKISKAEKTDLNIIKKIRNQFAHVAAPMTFESGKIPDQCKGLFLSYHSPSGTPREHFTATIFGLLARINIETLKCEAPDIKADDTPSKEDKEKFRSSIEKRVKEQFENGA
ncbi:MULTISPECIES: hypothetical protein [Vibrio]|nr:hypothetical protein [Vibrio parahaemolyticus]HDY7883370.1 hypothetical protein [Vibrio vulnificus]EGR2303273.1 hypothetical protein [Vibrio parahaemolyticus]EHH1260439.1 hypothetical protein [Vibrio parahaemolyticus]EHR0555807.1 hypothetical protein [Vibrio parahaemolyticus]ELA9392550.1 hypothetical protein [Vibrio parahaemolyticus]